ncbi:MAG TPA: hypothetical protein VMT35_06190 [Ignavibacteriaceae bacterium]|nr:hypothetical protein [Ignavibacteriaceae bacterium]
MLEKNRLNSVSNIVIIVAVIELAGVITMLCGFLYSKTFIIYFGIFVSCATAFTIIILTITSNINVKGGLTYKSRKL